MLPNQLLLLLATVASSSSGGRTAVPDGTTVIIESVNAPWTFVPIGPENVTELVLDDRQAWVVYFHQGFIYEPFREVADRLRGLVHFGLVHREDWKTAELLKLDSTSAGLQFRALPFGSADHKLSNCLDTDVLDAAVNHAGASVPDDAIVRLSGEESLRQLLTEGLYAKPSKFTVIFTIRDATPTLLQRVLSQKLSLAYNFGLLTRATPGQALDSLGLPSDLRVPVPGLLLLQPRSDGSGLEISRLDESGISGGEDSDSELVYAEALRFLVEYNRQFRVELPGDNRADDESLTRLTELLRRERLSFNIVDWSELRRQEL